MTAGIRTDSKRGWLDRLPYGVDEGAAKLMRAYQAYYMVTNSQTDDSLVQCAQRLSSLSQKIDGYEQRSAGLKAGFKKYAGKGASFLAENSAVFGAAALGLTAGGGTGGVAAMTAATFPQSFGNAFVKEMGKAGYDVKDPEQIVKAYHDQDFMRLARRASYIRAGQMSGAVFLAGHLAGYIYSAVAKPVASAGASVFRSVMPKIFEGFAERSAPYAGDAIAQGVRGAVNAVGKNAFQRIPVRALFLTATVGKELVQEKILDSQASQERTRGLPSYNRTAMYL